MHIFSHSLNFEYSDQKPLMPEADQICHILNEVSDKTLRIQRLDELLYTEKKHDPTRAMVACLPGEKIAEDEYLKILAGSKLAALALFIDPTYVTPRIMSEMTNCLEDGREETVTLIKNQLSDWLLKEKNSWADHASWSPTNIKCPVALRKAAFQLMPELAAKGFGFEEGVLSILTGVPYGGWISKTGNWNKDEITQETIPGKTPWIPTSKYHLQLADMLSNRKPMETPDDWVPLAELLAYEEACNLQLPNNNLPNRWAKNTLQHWNDFWNCKSGDRPVKNWPRIPEKKFIAGQLVEHSSWGAFCFHSDPENPPKGLPKLWRIGPITGLYVSNGDPKYHEQRIALRALAFSQWLWLCREHHDNTLLKLGQTEKNRATTAYIHVSKIINLDKNEARNLSIYLKRINEIVDYCSYDSIKSLLPDIKRNCEKICETIEFTQMFIEKWQVGTIAEAAKLTLAKVNSIGMESIQRITYKDTNDNPITIFTAKTVLIKEPTPLLICEGNRTWNEETKESKAMPPIGIPENQVCEIIEVDTPNWFLQTAE